VVAFISAKIAIAFLIGLAPIFVPLMLLQVTKTYFTKWAMQLLSYLLQPIFIFAFLSLTLVMLDTTIFRGEYSLSAIWFDDPVNSYDDWNREVREKLELSAEIPESLIDIELTPQGFNDTANEYFAMQNSEQAGFGWLTRMQASGCTGPEADNPDCDQNAAIQQNVELAANLFAMVTATDGGMEPEVILQLVVTLLMCYLLYSLIGVIPDMARDIVGSHSHAKLGAASLPMEQQMRAASDNFDFEQLMGGFK